MRFVAYSEVLIMARVLLGAILLRNSLITPLVYAHFLRLRFYMSSFTRTSFQHVRAILDNATAKPECPAVVRRGYLTFMDLLHRYGNSVVSVPQGQQAGASPAAANGTAATPANGAAH